MSKFSIDDTVGKPNQNTASRIDSSESESVQNSAAGGSPSANGPRAAPSGGNGRANEIVTRESKKVQPVFSVAKDDWAAEIPNPGHYAATVTSASIKLKSKVVFLSIDYRIVDNDGRPFTLTDFLVLDAPQEDSVYIRTAQGKGRVKGIMEANGKALQFSDIQAVPAALIGCRVTIAVGHRDVDGLPAPTVHGIVGPTQPANDQP
jgi:hypothetical protein